MSIAGKIVDFLAGLHPVFKKPLKSEPLHKKLRNVILIVIAYALLSEVRLPYIDPNALERFKYLELVFGSSFGTLMTLGIGPVIMGGLLAELLYAARDAIKPFRELDLKTEEGKKRYMKYVMALTIFMLFWEALTYTMRIAEPTLIGRLVVFGLLVIGGYIAILMVEYTKKYGVLSAISLFVLYRVSRSVFVSLFNPIGLNTTAEYIPSGKVIQLLHYVYGVIQGNQDIIDLYNNSIGPMILMPILGTIFLWVLVSYLNKVRVEVPNMAGGKQEYTLLMQSVMPIIFGAFFIQFLQSILSFANGFIHSSTIEHILTLLTTPFGYLSWYDKIHWLVYSITFAFPGVLFSYIFTKRMIDENMITDFYDYVMSLDLPGRTKFRKGFAKRINVFSMRTKLINTYLAFYSAVVAVIIALIGNAFGVAAGGSGIILAIMISENIVKQLQQELKRHKMAPYKTPKDLFIYTIKKMFVSEQKD